MKLSAWCNLLGYQLVWFGDVAAASRARPWLGVLAALIFIIWQLIVSPRRGVDLQLVAVAFLLGSVVDGVLAASGFARYAAPSPSVPPGGAPIWILALWSAFAMTLNHSLVWLRGRLGIAVAFGALGGPLAYASAARGWGALEFAAPQWHAIAWLAAGWGVAMAVLVTITTRHANGFSDVGVGIR